MSRSGMLVGIGSCLRDDGTRRTPFSVITLVCVVLAFALGVSACGGGSSGGGGDNGGTDETTDDGTGDSTDDGTDGGTDGESGDETTTSNAIGLKADGLDKASYLALGNQLSGDSQTAAVDSFTFEPLFAFFLRQAHAATPATHNILAYDENGEPIESPVSTDVDVLISEMAEGPAGEYLYLAIQDRHNSAAFTDYAALEGERCTLYRITKSTETVSCLMTHTEYDPYISTANGALADNSSESFIKFDPNGNGYFIVFDQDSEYGTGGTEKQRLVRVTSDGTVETVRDIDGYHARGLVYARNGKVLFTEEQFFSELEDGESPDVRAYLIDPEDGAFEAINHPDYLDKLASSPGRAVFWSNGTDVYRLDQGDRAFVKVLSGEGRRVTALHRSPAGSVFAQMEDGPIWALGPAEPTVIADVNGVPRDPSHPIDSPSADDSSNFTYPYLASSERWMLSRGETASGDPTVCVIDLESYDQTCSDQELHAYEPLVHTLAVVADQGYVYFTSNEIFQQAKLDLPGYIESPERNTAITESSVGDGSAVATVALRPPVTLDSDLETVSVESSAAEKTAGGERWTELYFDFSAPVYELPFDALSLVTADTGEVQDASFSLVDDGRRMIVTVAGDADAASPQWIDPAAGDTFTLELPEGVRVPGQTFESGFESRSVSITLGS